MRRSAEERRRVKAQVNANRISPEKMAKLAANFEPRVRLVWWDEEHVLRFKVMPWHKPCTNQALSEWMQNYLQMVREGYLPKGFQKAPIPHCARVYRVASQILAEWYAPKVAAVKTA